MPQDALDFDNSSVSPSEVHAELEAVLRSPAFERSERLQRFLRYICELTLNGESGRINEYLIGSEVFRKGADYNPNEDSIVRRQAHTLRQKLQDYYSGEGSEHLLRIELPVGRYMPVFRRREQPTGAIAAAAPTPLSSQPEKPKLDLISGPPPAETHRNLGIRRIMVPLGVALVFLLGWAVGRWSDAAPKVVENTRISPAAQELWGPWLTHAREVVICFSNPITAVVKHFEEPIPPSALPKRFPMHPADEAVFRDVLRLPPGGRMYFTPVVNQAKMGEAIAGVAITRFFAGAGKSVNATQSRFLSWEDLTRQNLIILGHNEANHWIDPILKKQPFRLAPTSAKEQRGIVNTQPAPGEKPSYTIAFGGENDADEEYALVSMLPGFENQHPLLLISGLNTQATQMATEYLTKEASINELLSRLRAADPKHSGPWRFQAVLKTEVHDKVPTNVSLITVRVIK
jgi:hypothetical protein